VRSIVAATAGWITAQRIEASGGQGLQRAAAQTQRSPYSASAASALSR
jgi:hypothetical protein